MCKIDYHILFFLYIFKISPEGYTKFNNWLYAEVGMGGLEWEQRGRKIPYCIHF